MKAFNSCFNKLPEGLKNSVNKSPLIIGIGPSAWPRIISSFYFPKFKILCYSDCQDNKFIRDSGVEVFSLKEQDPDLELEQITPGKILSTDLAKNFLATQREPFVLLIYKSLGTLEKVCQENGWKFLGNKKELRDRYEDKRIFKEILDKIGIEKIPGETIPIDELTGERFANYQKKLGQKKLVLQIAEATWGGGSGTLFIDDQSQLAFFKKRVSELRKVLEGKKKKLENVNIAPFIQGVSASIPCCATRYGVLTGSVQTQVIDVAEVGTKIRGRSGNFAGHDWSFKHFNEDIQKQATRIAQRFGDYLYKNGYKGIFGMDIIIDEKGKVWPVECNPRETDAFPLICMLQMEKQAIPMQVFHNLEHLEIDYDFDFNEVDESYKQNFDASQIILYNKMNKNVVDRGVFKAGIYKIEEGKLKYLRSGFQFSDVKNSHEYLFTEDIPKEAGNPYYAHERILRLIKRGGVLAKESILTDEVKQIIDLVYRELKLMSIENGLKNEHGLKILFTNKLIDAKNSTKFEEADLVNIIRKSKGGFRRPLSIAWRREITEEPILGQIDSKRTRKHIKSDIKKLSELGIEIKTFPKINQEIFEKWLEVYKNIISAKQKGEVLVDNGWLAQKEKKGKRVGAVLAFKDGKVIGGDIFFPLKNGKTLSVGYGVAEKIQSLSGSLTLLLDYYFMVYAQEQGYSSLSFGQDTNFYGFDLSTGLIFYKTKLGFHPIPATKTYWVSTYFKNSSKFSDKTMFFSEENGKLILSILLKDIKAINKEDIILPYGVEEYRIFPLEKIVKDHNRLF